MVDEQYLHDLYAAFDKAMTSMHMAPESFGSPAEALAVLLEHERSLGAFFAQQARGEAVAEVDEYNSGFPNGDEELLVYPRKGARGLKSGDLLYAAPHAPAAVPSEWWEAVQEFVDRCDRGEVRSTYTYNKFKGLLATSAPAKPCRYHGNDAEACETYSGQVPCDPAEPDTGAD